MLGTVVNLFAVAACTWAIRRTFAMRRDCASHLASLPVASPYRARWAKLLRRTVWMFLANGVAVAANLGLAVRRLT